MQKVRHAVGHRHLSTIMVHNVHPMFSSADCVVGETVTRFPHASLIFAQFLSPRNFCLAVYINTPHTSIEEKHMQGYDWF